MRMILIIALISSINLLAGCGNVVPQTGPTMEQVYDGMEENTEIKKDGIQKKIISVKQQKNDFYKLPNPELTLLVYPHLAGKDEIPIPSYVTHFNVYSQDHYATTRAGLI